MCCWLMHAVHFLGPMACTQSSCQWLIPAHVKNITYRPLSEIDFASAKRTRKEMNKRLDAAAGSDDSAACSDVHVTAAMKPSSSATIAAPLPLTPNASDISKFYAALNECPHKAAVLSLIPPYSEQFVSDCPLPISPLTTLFSHGYESLSIPELISVAETVDITVAENEADTVELLTRGQSSNKAWYHLRAGRVTGSNFKEVCCTDSEKPSVSLLRRICYPSECRVKVPATEWGVLKETAAVAKYKQFLTSHKDVTVEKCGLVINADFAFMGASTDAFVSCACCGNGVVEVKCPYKYRDNTIPEYMDAKDSCFELGANGIQLKRNHAYYYQVQAQLHVCDVRYCDFVVCTFPSDEATIAVVRTYKDASFWEECFKKAACFFRVCILPELLGKCYTRRETS